MTADIRMFVDEGLCHSSGAVDLDDGTAAVVDPPGSPTEHLAAIGSSDATPRGTIDDHSPADYVTGGASLVPDHGATFIAPNASELATPHHGVGDDDALPLAPGMSLRAAATPGHTPDHHAFVLEVSR